MIQKEAREVTQIDCLSIRRQFIIVYLSIEFWQLHKILFNLSTKFDFFYFSHLFYQCCNWFKRKFTYTLRFSLLKLQRTLCSSRVYARVSEFVKSVLGRILKYPWLGNFSCATNLYPEKFIKWKIYKISAN